MEKKLQLGEHNVFLLTHFIQINPIWHQTASHQRRCGPFTGNWHQRHVFMDSLLPQTHPSWQHFTFSPNLNKFSQTERWGNRPPVSACWNKDLGLKNGAEESKWCQIGNRISWWFQTSVSESGCCSPAVSSGPSRQNHCQNLTRSLSPVNAALSVPTCTFLFFPRLDRRRWDFSAVPLVEIKSPDNPGCFPTSTLPGVSCLFSLIFNN